MPNTEQVTVTPNVLTTSNSLAEKPTAKVGFSLKLIPTLELANGDLVVLKWICGKLILDLKLIPLIHVPFPVYFFMYILLPV